MDGSLVFFYSIVISVPIKRGSPWLVSMIM